MMAHTSKLASPRTDYSRRPSALPQIHKLWECFGHTFGDRDKYSEDDDDTELTHNFFYRGGGESALDDFDKIYDDDEYVPEERPRPIKHSRKAVTSTSRSPICVDDFVDIASQVGKSAKSSFCARKTTAQCSLSLESAQSSCSSSTLADQLPIQDIYSLIDVMVKEQKGHRQQYDAQQRQYQPPRRLVQRPQPMHRTCYATDSHSVDSASVWDCDEESKTSSSLFTTNTAPLCIFDDASTGTASHHSWNHHRLTLNRTNDADEPASGKGKGLVLTRACSKLNENRDIAASAREPRSLLRRQTSCSSVTSASSWLDWDANWAEITTTDSDDWDFSKKAHGLNGDGAMSSPYSRRLNRRRHSLSDPTSKSQSPHLLNALSYQQVEV
jgi:hypothetical protein